MTTVGGVPESRAALSRRPISPINVPDLIPISSRLVFCPVAHYLLSRISMFQHEHALLLVAQPDLRFSHVCLSANVRL